MSEALTYTFDHVHIYCSDLAASERWFVEGIGAEVVRRREIGGVPATDLRLGGATIFLRGPKPGEKPAAGLNVYGTDHIGLEVKDLQAAARELKGRGIQFEVEPYEISPGVQIAFVIGPDSVRVELLQRGR